MLKHYSPKSKLILANWDNLEDLYEQIQRIESDLQGVHLITHNNIPSNAQIGRIIVIPQDAKTYARAIYAEMHQCDKLGAKLIVIERLPDKPEWQPILDRLIRASSD